MKFLCDSCSRLVELREFALHDGALVLVCPACREESRVPPPEALQRTPAPVLELARPKPPPSGPLCPKCGAARVEGAESCAKCGLVYALFKPENLALPRPLEELWKGCEASWTDADRHTAFLAACVSAEVLSEAARRYRVRAEHAPGDGIATRFRDEAVARLMAVAEVPLEHTTPEQHQARGVLIAVVLVGASLAALLTVIFKMLRMPPP